MINHIWIVCACIVTLALATFAPAEPAPTGAHIDVDCDSLWFGLTVEYCPQPNLNWTSQQSGNGSLMVPLFVQYWTGVYLYDVAGGTYTYGVYLLAESFQATPGTVTLNLPGGVPLVLKHIPAGSYLMGRYSGEQDSQIDEDPQHAVTIATDLYMGRYELTKRQWTAVMGTTPWSGLNVISDPDSPAVGMSWNDTQAFITALNTHLADSEQGTYTVRLPSEAEWEYAARAGTTTRFYWGNDPSETQIGNYAWYEGNAEGVAMPGPHVVGQKLPNAWGLYDMSGNVWEWCQDWYNISYTGAPNDGSAWESPSTSSRLLRGGDWFSGAGFCRSAERFSCPPGNSDSNWGFRVVAVPVTGQ